MTRPTLFLLLLFAGVVSRAEAQVSYDGCVDPFGVPVASINAPQLEDVAMANRDQLGRPIIWYNPSVLVWLQPVTRTFFYFHECAHHVLGHSIGAGHPLMNEQAADCWAIVQMVELGLLPQGVAVIQQDIARAGRGDWTHLPGPQRAINLQRCLTG